MSDGMLLTVVALVVVGSAGMVAFMRASTGKKKSRKANSLFE
jgi:hypothetical protein